MNHCTCNTNNPNIAIATGAYREHHKNCPKNNQELAMARKDKKNPEPQNDSPERGPENLSEINDKSSPSGDGGNDNLVSAVDAVAGSLEPSVSGRVDSDSLADVSVLVRLPGWMRDEWNEAASRVGKSQAEFVRDAVNGVVDPLLRCQHPVGARLVYPWSETCTLCGVRVRG